MTTRKITKKNIRKGPSESATKFILGTKKKGNDGNMWIIHVTSSGIHRWKKITKTKTKKKVKYNNDLTNVTIKKSTDVSTVTLKKLKKKYKVTTHGSKKEIAEGLWRVRGHAMDTNDLALILHLLPKKIQKEVNKLLNTRNNTINNYKGLWKPLPKPLSKMDRNELIKNLKLFRDAWEKITTRDQDLSNERLENETTEDLRSLLKFYYTNEAKNLATSWLN